MEDALVWLIVRLSIGLFLLWVVNRLVVGIIAGAAKRAGLPQGELRLLKEVIWAIFIVLAVITVVNVSGLASAFTILTVSGIVAIVFSLALQTTLTNVISGFLVMLENTVRTNDLIEFGGIKGEVIKLGLRSTWVKTGDGDLAIISNSQIANGPFINYTARQRLQSKL